MEGSLLTSVPFRAQDCLVIVGCHVGELFAILPTVGVSEAADIDDGASSSGDSNMSQLMSLVSLLCEIHRK